VIWNLRLGYDFPAFVRTAVFANAVRQLQLTALLAFHHARNFQLEVSAALVAASFGYFSKRYCHDSHLLMQINELLLFEKIRQPG
jgi:hypothetical protein